jgi:hypothetical protein
MPTTQQIDRFTLAFHEQAVTRLRADEGLLEQARGTLVRWRKQRGETRSDAYLDQWAKLLEGGVDAVERAVCRDDDAAATLRNASPLGFLLSPAEREAVRRASGL